MCALCNTSIILRFYKKHFFFLLNTVVRGVVAKYLHVSIWYFVHMHKSTIRQWYNTKYWTITSIGMEMGWKVELAEVHWHIIHHFRLNRFTILPFTETTKFYSMMEREHCGIWREKLLCQSNIYVYCVFSSVLLYRKT